MVPCYLRLIDLLKFDQYLFYGLLVCVLTIVYHLVVAGFSIITACVFKVV